LDPSKRGLFDVKSFYNVLVPHDNTPFPWRSIWQSKAPLRVSFFAWSALLGKIFTMNNLRKRYIDAALGKILTHDNLRKKNVIAIEWCCLCKKSGESIDHLLLHCEITRDLWSYILILFGVEWVMP
jgi:hypothetical protein